MRLNRQKHQNEREVCPQDIYRVDVEGIKINDSTFSVTMKTKKGINSVITEKFTVILKVTSCKSYILIDIKR